MLAAPPRKVYTDEELVRLPKDGYKYEVVDGELMRMPTFFEHDFVRMLLLSRLLPIAMPLGYLTGGEAGCRMQGGNLRVPDVSFTRKSRIHEILPRPGFSIGAPDLCIEIISSSEEPTDTQRKVHEYFQSGASQVWHILPDTTIVKVFTSPWESVTLAGDDALDGGELIPGFQMRVGDLFDIGLS